MREMNLRNSMGGLRDLTTTLRTRKIYSIMKMMKIIVLTPIRMKKLPVWDSFFGFQGEETTISHCFKAKMSRTNRST